MTPGLPLHSADPALSANLYCDHHLDALLQQAIAPFWSELREDGHLRHAALWFTRYTRRGEHLKLRLHLPVERVPWARERLEAAAARFFGSLKDVPLPERNPPSFAPPIDVEDQPTTNAPDRSLLWTTFRRSPVVLGTERYLQDSRHAGLFAQALSASAEVVLTQLMPEVPRPTYARKRQSLLIQMLIAALGETAFTAAQWQAYLEYHHGWLLRHLLSNKESSTFTRESILAEFDQRALQMQPAIDALSATMAVELKQGPGSVPPDHELSDWRTSVRAFFQHAATYRGHADYDVDPYTGDFAFLPLFKLLHGCANQFGFRVNNELYTHHLLLLAARKLTSTEHGAGFAVSGECP
ncbi:lantibiotic dehydratase C-terminal domain-containing protein [Corallococcus caeni]|uniref:Thiopeptide-type bacteriocin biosynthesis domain-containing protein n=1 Tax=Corallococcus caeni TaxID=3082388 RepID=A0ABQ6QVI8_9BACT|nr:hypothetical protein ASNO1_42420 [Corallococcus sp. NO1]